MNGTLVTTCPPDDSAGELTYPVDDYGQRLPDEREGQPREFYNPSSGRNEPVGRLKSAVELTTLPPPPPAAPESYRARRERELCRINGSDPTAGPARFQAEIEAHLATLRKVAPESVKELSQTLQESRRLENCFYEGVAVLASRFGEVDSALGQVAVLRSANADDEAALASAKALLASADSCNAEAGALLQAQQRAVHLPGIMAERAALIEAEIKRVHDLAGTDISLAAIVARRFDLTRNERGQVLDPAERSRHAAGFYRVS